MIRDSRVSKYLLYAVGEIILVVIGILIALQINNWNQIKSEEAIEKTYMTNLLEDLQDDLVNYKKFKNSNQEIYTLIDSIIPNLKDDNRKEKVSQLAYWCRMVTIKWHNLYTVERTFEQMKSSGHLRLIKNNDVANAISNYYNSLSEFDAYDEAAMLWAEDYVASVGNIFDAEIMMKILNSRTMEEAQESDILTDDPIILNQLMLSLTYFEGALRLWENVSVERDQDVKDLIALIESSYELNQ